MLKNLFYLLLALFFSIGYFSSAYAKDLVIGTSGTYPPFEYIENGELKGFDIDLGKLIGKELGAEVSFKDMQFSTLFTALNNGQIDIVIATLSVTPEREKNFDFSDVYYFGGISALFKSAIKIHTKEDLVRKKIAAQLGTTISLWARKNVPNIDLVEFDEISVAIEALKAGHVEVMLLDLLQAPTFVNKNRDLSEVIIADSDAGYAIAFKKGSGLVYEVNKILRKLDEGGEIKKLEKKWLMKIE